MHRGAMPNVMLLAIASILLAGGHAQGAPPVDIGTIATVVVIYAENRGFDTLYGSFPDANGLQQADIINATQLDRDGSVLRELPPIWGGITAKDVTPRVTQSQTQHLPNHPFAIDDPAGLKLPLSVATRDLWHRFYQNQMQIDGGRNDKFVAYADSGRCGRSPSAIHLLTTFSWAPSAAHSLIING